MKKIGLSIYGFHVKDNDVDETNLQNLRGHDFVEIINEFADQYDNLYDKDEKSENIFTIISTESDKRENERGQIIYNFVSGKVKTGDFGIVSELIDTTNGRVKNRNREDAEVLPFSFGFMYSGGNVDHGVIVFQTEGRYGMKTNFINRFKIFLREHYSGVQFTIAPMIPVQFVSTILNKGALKKLRFLRYVAPADTNQRLGVNEGIHIKEERIFSNLAGVIERKREAILGFITGKNGIREIANIDDFDYDELRMEFNISGSIKTLNITNIDRIVITIELKPEELEIVDGHPTHESLKQLIEQNAYDYLEAVRK